LIFSVLTCFDDLERLLFDVADESMTKSTRERKKTTKLISNFRRKLFFKIQYESIGGKKLREQTVLARLKKNALCYGT
jgi:hypothetical protein